MDNLSNAVLIQAASLADVESMIERALEKRMKAFYESIKPRPSAKIKRKDAAKMLGKSLPTIDSYASHGLLHKQYIGGMVYFDEEELLALKGG